MNKNRLISRAILFLVVSFLNGAVWAEISVYEFEEEAEQEQFYHLIGELRCPKCQNQNIADSNAPIALDIKDRVYELVKDGKSDREITEFLIDRFGEFVTYRPLMKPSTYVLWFGPFSLLVFAAVVLFIRIRKKSKSSDSTLQDRHPDEERIKQILDKHH